MCLHIFAKQKEELLEFCFIVLIVLRKKTKTRLYVAKGELRKMMIYDLNKLAFPPNCGSTISTHTSLVLYKNLQRQLIRIGSHLA